jgi:DNA replication protein DnaC
MSPPPRPVRLAEASTPRAQTCPLGVCDGSGWILGPEDVARPCECRAARQARRRARGVSSTIPPKFRGVSFDRPPISDMPSTAVDEVRRYLDDLDKNVAAGRGLWIYGDVGTGKTSLAMLVSKAAVESGHTVAIYSLPQLLSRIRRTYDSEAGEESYLGFFERLTSVDLLHIDDVGVEKRTDWVLEQLYAIVNERYENERSVVLTTNLNKDDLEKQIDERTVSRLFEICGEFMVPIHGEDMRMPR